MDVEIAYMKKVDEGTLISGLVRRVERPSLPHNETGDTDEIRNKKTQIWKDALDVFAVDDREVKTLHLGKAELTQYGEEG